MTYELWYEGTATMTYEIWIRDLTVTSVIERPHTTTEGARQYIIRFPNDYGVSIIPEYDHNYPYNGYVIRPGVVEIAILKFDGIDSNDWSFAETDIDDENPMRYVLLDEVEEVLRTVAALS